MENAPTAIMLSRLCTFLRTVGRIALIPDDHVTSGHLNGLRPVTRDAERHGFTVPGGDHGCAIGFRLWRTYHFGTRGRLLVILGLGIHALLLLSPVQNR